MKLPPLPLLAAYTLVLGIVALAGFVDAYSFVQFKELFVSFMSGNTTLLGVAVVRHEDHHGRQLALVISLFISGVVLGTLLHNRVGPRWAAPVLLALVAALLLSAQLWAALGVGTLTLAMGVLNASVHKLGEVPISLTFFTGALVKFGIGLGNLLSGRHESWAWVGHFALWLGFLGGAVGGAFMAVHQPPTALPLAAGFGLALAELACGARGLR